MFRTFRCFADGLKIVAAALVIMVGIGASPAAALAQSGTTTVITAVVAPVRYILVDRHDKLEQILSNTPKAVPPVVYRGSFNTAPIALTPDINRQYAKILATTDQNRTGIIYPAAKAEAKKPGLVSQWLNLARRVSLLPR